ncbi:MAG TPA: mycothiol system anti-sigma-R factor [Acidimicrobiales bacterium]|nr:mycothiol system anti-sigma-R factor [Acidimicrobiales bacterium]
MGTGSSGGDCSESIERLYSYLDGELTDERRAAIARHLDDCPPCGDAFDFESELRVVIASRCKDRVPEQLRDRIHEALLEEERRRQSTGN